MRLSSRIDAVRALARSLGGKPACVFIISHMRSRSSLLAHILGSHPDVLGYFERHRSYSAWTDLLKLRAQVYMKEKQDPRERYVLDKILHDSHSISESVLRDRSVRLIFLVREPEATTRSLVHMSRRTGVEYYAVPANAVDYYCQRLAVMQHYASASHLNGFFIESDELLCDTSGVLGDLSAWLELSTPLQADYSIFEHTGEFGHGDPLECIRSGRVVRTRSHDEIRVPQALLALGMDAYDSCRSALAPLLVGRRSRRMAPSRGEP